MKTKFLSVAAVAVSGALLLSSCAPGGGDADSAPPAETAADGQLFTVEPTDSGLADLGDDFQTQDGVVYVTTGATEFSSYNGETPTTYNTYTSTVLNHVLGGFVYYGTDGAIYQDEEYGSFEVLSEEPLVVEYTIHEDATWSDGTPITAADWILAWGAQNPRITGTGDDGEEGPLFDSVSHTFGEYVLEAPEGDTDGKVFTIEYKEPYPDYQLVVSGALPAHVVAEQAGLSVEELIDLVRAEDSEGLVEAAEFWNTGWHTSPGTLPDEALIPSSGQYKLSSWDAGQSITITANDNYWGTPAGIRDITFRFVEEDTHVQSLRNGDLNVIEPQATIDTLDQLEGLDGVIVHQFDQLTWEHLDFNFENGPFADSLELRQAFAMCVPRQHIVDSLITPLNPDAVVANAREVLPFQEGYEELIAESYDGSYDEVDIEGAREILEEADQVGLDVRIGYNSPNPRRTDIVAAIKDSCDQAGFNILDGGSSTFFGPGGEQEKGDYEVALFAWAGSGQIASGRNIYSTGLPQNMNGYSNDTVDEAWNILAGSLDESVHAEQRTVIETELWNDLHGIPLFAHPGIAASSDDLYNVRPTSTQDTILWNNHQWQRAQ